MLIKVIESAECVLGRVQAGLFVGGGERCVRLWVSGGDNDYFCKWKLYNQQDKSSMSVILKCSKQCTSNLQFKNYQKMKGKAY